MSRIISYTTGDRAEAVGYLGAAERLTEEQRRVLDMIRERAEASRRDLERQGLDWGLTIPEALEHLIEGRADAPGTYAGKAYVRALQHIIDHCGSDSADLGVYSKPSTFFGLLDEQLKQHGVAAELLPHGYLFSGPPDEIPFYLPYAVDGPDIGMLPLALAKPAVDAYRAARDKIDPDFLYDLDLLIERLEFEHEEWESTKARGYDWYTHDTVFFSING
ncbi:hypothetical protein [Streptomyces sp. CC208A]|uniref:DUF7691 family protein n=1 Tax=Streptomyces sp. CC208A TaxID=3044573 RepID=UPI0024A8E8C3|nr:hypothetical protein [Streptomyces sp. CC208A]